MEDKKIIWFLIAGILAVALAVAAFFIFFNKTTQNPPNPSRETGNANKIVRSERTLFDPRVSYPPGFPSGLPLDKPLDVTDNFQVKITYPSDPFVPQTNSSQNGETSGISAMDPKRQAVVTATKPAADVEKNGNTEANPVTYAESTVTYATGIALKDSAAAYKKYLQDNGWTIAFDNGTDNIHFFQVAKQTERLSYSYSPNVISGKNYITLVYSKPELTQEEKNFIKELQETNKK